MATDRFRLRRPDFSHVDNPYLDGGWWPESADLGAEVEQLLADVDPTGFHTRRVLYNLEDGWTRPPRRMVAGGRQIKLSGYHTQRKAVLTLLDDAGRRLELVVVPPSTDARVAERAMRIAG
ncbi:MAG TPA: DUF5994 family protein, partial [Jatrophihabitans sp.]|nr:DUF5994 family protein [Jatrophihabitans sp.]